MNDPTAEELKIMADQLVKFSIDYVMDPTSDKLAEANLARITLHAGIALVLAKPRDPIGRIDPPNELSPYKHFVRLREPRDDEVGKNLYAIST